MKLSIFQSAKGDCFLLQGQDGKLVLCDGGMGSSMKNHVRAELGKLRAKKKELDYIYVSHIDNDHIEGILQILQDEADWRVYDHKKKNGDNAKKPAVPRPPKVKGILHNGFSHLISGTDKSIDSLANAFTAADMLSSMAPALVTLQNPVAIDRAEDIQNLALGVKESIGVAQLIDDDALDISLNKPPGVAKAGKLLRVGGKGDKFNVGGMTWTMIGPTSAELQQLRDGWLEFLRDEETKRKIADLRAEIKKKVDAFGSGALSGSPFDLAAEWDSYKGVTVPNIASMMYMVEEGNKRLLLTGDGQQDFILKGLETRGFMPKGGAVHLDVLKVQHHGSEHNTDVDFAQRVSADHYVFGANGQHENPDMRVLKILFESRLGPQKVRAKDPKANNRLFTWWFSTTSAAQSGEGSKAYFAEVEKAAKKYAARSGGMMKVRFNGKAFIDLQV